MSFSAEPPAAADDVASPDLAARLGVPRIEHRHVVGSTLDLAHELAAAGAPAGTLVIADAQVAGRGRLGRTWRSAAGAGLWLTLIERPANGGALDVLALRCGLLAAEALTPLATGPVGVKWPNDLLVGDRKLAGVLIETRWRGSHPEWIAIGFGVNLRDPDIPTGIGLAPGVTRRAALEPLVPALRRAARCVGPLTEDELARWHERDVMRGRAILHPAPGRVAGVTPGGDLVVRDAAGVCSTHRSGSLVPS